MHYMTSLYVFNFSHLVAVVWRFMLHVSKFHPFQILWTFHLVPIIPSIFGDSMVFSCSDFEQQPNASWWMKHFTFPVALLEGTHFPPSPVVTSFNDYFHSHLEGCEVMLPSD